MRHFLRANLNSRRVLLIALGTLLWFVEVTNSVLACSPPSNPWYTEYISIDPGTIPPGFHISPNQARVALTISSGDGRSLDLVSPHWSREVKSAEVVDANVEALWNYEDRQVYDLPRPPDAQPPAPQTAVLRLRQEGTQWDVPVHITYTLRDNYRPWVTRDFQAMCDRDSHSAATAWHNTNLVALFVGLALVSGVIVALLRRNVLR